MGLGKSLRIRSTRQPTAGRLAREAAPHVICRAGQAPCRRLRVTSNAWLMSKFLVYVLVPHSVSPENISGFAHSGLSSYRMSDDGKTGWYDYLCRLGPVFDDQQTEMTLPNRVRRELGGHICDVSRLPPESEPFALVTADGVWHAVEVCIRDYRLRTNDESNECPALDPRYYEDNRIARVSWPRRYADLIRLHPCCWVVATWAHC